MFTIISPGQVGVFHDEPPPGRPAGRIADCEVEVYSKGTGSLSSRKGGVMEESGIEAREIAGEISKLWWLWVVFGVAWIVISLVILQFTSASLTTIGIIVGIFLLVAGFQEFAMAMVSEGWKWLWVIFGVLFVIGGIVALAYPKNTFAAIADMLGFLFLLIGIFWIIESFAVKAVNDLWWLDLIAGILMVILAFWTGGQFFITKVYTLLTFAGIFALLHGITDIIRAFQLRKLGKIVVS
jgi:uncharacterized membrane protein HdeD (DUF308 family)